LFRRRNIWKEEVEKTTTMTILLPMIIIQLVKSDFNTNKKNNNKNNVVLERWKTLRKRCDEIRSRGFMDWFLLRLTFTRMCIRVFLFFEKLTFRTRRSVLFQSRFVFWIFNWAAECLRLEFFGNAVFPGCNLQPMVGGTNFRSRGQRAYSVRLELFFFSFDVLE